MENNHVNHIADFLRRESGLCFAGRRKATLRFHLERRVARLGLAGLGSYWEILKSSPDEQRGLYDLVTVNETSFFRNAQQFDDLRTRIVPQLDQEKGLRLMRRWGEADAGPRESTRKLRVLSAGCSTGEEPYSIAMSLLDTLRYPLAWDIEILAGDLNEECLSFASRGHYEEGRLKGIPESYRERFLRRDGEGWSLKDEVKGLVRFVKLNLARVCEGAPFPGLPEGFAGFDLVFCRNVMIYFPAPTQQQLIDALQGLLAPGGYLFTGDAEPLHLHRHDLETVSAAGSLIYRKKASGGGPEAPTPADPTEPAEAAPAGGDRLTGLGVEDLLRLVADASFGRRDEALKRLLALPMVSVDPILEDAVRNDGDAELRNGAMEVLVAFGEKAVPRLCMLLKAGNDEVRNFSAVMLGSIGSRSAVPDLVLALEDSDLNVRHGAAEALGRIGDSRALEPLFRLLTQGFWLQFPAIEALGALGSPAAVPRLCELLNDDVLFEPVVQALESIGDSAALPGLRALSRDADPRKARLAAQAITAIQNKGSL